MTERMPAAWSAAEGSMRSVGVCCDSGSWSSCRPGSSGSGRTTLVWIGNAEFCGREGVQRVSP